MSYDISLVDPVTKETLHAESVHDIKGGTYALNGTDKLWLNITYNYSNYYYEATEGDKRFVHDEVSAYYADGTKGATVTEYGIRGIYGKTGAESIPMLKDMISRIAEKHPDLETDNDYWKPTAGNAVKPLYQLIAFAQLRPDGIWEGD